MFPQRLKKLRKQKNLTQTELANLLNLSHGAIAMWETDKRQPDNDTLVRLANFFGVSVDYLLGVSNEEPEYTEDEKEMFELMAQLTDEEAKEMLNFLQYLVAKRQKK